MRRAGLAALEVWGGGRRVVGWAQFRSYRCETRLWGPPRSTPGMLRPARGGGSAFGRGREDWGCSDPGAAAPVPSGGEA